MITISSTAASSVATPHNTFPLQDDGGKGEIVLHEGDEATKGERITVPEIDTAHVGWNIRVRFRRVPDAHI